jgi:hypothetical protein
LLAIRSKDCGVITNAKQYARGSSFARKELRQPCDAQEFFAKWLSRGLRTATGHPASLVRKAGI